MKISLIVAMASNRAIGINNRLPWHLPADLKKFRKITMGSPILMGRKTYDSIGRPLPGRINIVISRNPDYRLPDCHVFNDIEHALAQFGHLPDIFVIGGSSFYQTLMPLASTLYVTQIRQAFAGDAFFPVIDPEHWRETEREDIDDDPDVPFDYSFVKLERIPR